MRSDIYAYNLHTVVSVTYKDQFVFIKLCMNYFSVVRWIYVRQPQTVANYELLFQTTYWRIRANISIYSWSLLKTKYNDKSSFFLNHGKSYSSFTFSTILSKIDSFYDVFDISFYFSRNSCKKCISVCANWKIGLERCCLRLSLQLVMRNT